MSASRNNVAKVAEVMEEVYGKYTSEHWIPKPYKENKGRYLWTDAFGVCNFLSLYNETKNRDYLKQAELLIDNVHNILGKDRKLQNRLGSSTEQEPLKGGLRIGKQDPEGTEDGDGQYFHYLTKWMFALNRYSIASQDSKYNDWAVQLIKAIHPYFVYNRASSRPRMYWKMSIDLSKPWVQSEGNLDPYDGYVTYRLVQQSCRNPSILKDEVSDMGVMVENKYMSYSSSDPLDLGEALWISHWFPEENWSKILSKRSLHALEVLWSAGEFHAPERWRLAFREFGTTLGVQVHPNAGEHWSTRVERLHSFWEDRIYKRDHDITPVMFCSSLLPGILQKRT